MLVETGYYLPTIPEQLAVTRWLYLVGLDRLRAVRAGTLDLVLDDLLESDETRAFLNVHEFENVRWFNQEKAELLVRAMTVAAPYALAFDSKADAAERTPRSRRLLR